ncbi:DUF6461 domain-containing protein [Actinomadura coerulea]|uniref:DUF6461 domain-containing protein n=1 Tax=Actinomadura coerulea TaxID=46159 RepID=UPI00343513E2
MPSPSRVVSHYRNINAVTLFHWWEDGELRTQFEWPVHRSGSSPDALVQTMAEVGFDLVGGSSDVAGNLALAEELTGVRITADLLDTSPYDTDRHHRRRLTTSPQDRHQTRSRAS